MSQEGGDAFYKMYSVYNSIRTEPDDLVILNVGGTIYNTTKRTLMKIKNGDVFTQMYNCVKNKKQVFIDRDGSLFKYILNFLRDGNKVVLPLCLQDLKNLLNEANYYKLKNLEIIIKKQINLTNCNT